MNRNIKGLITNEDPSIHWSFLPIEGETILDMGCGINNQEFIPTPMYWIQNKAKMVYGIDPSQPSYEWFKQNFNVQNFIQICDWVDRVEKFEMYFNLKPTIVKMDVEGSEIFMNAVKPECLDSVRHIGIEYHNLACLVSCESKLKECGFELDYYKFDHLDIDYQGVLHGFKKNIITKKGNNGL